MSKKLLIAALATVVTLSGCTGKVSFGDMWGSSVAEQPVSVPEKPLDKSLYIARATIDGKEINVPKGVDAQLFVNQFALAEELKKSNPEVYEKIQEEVGIKTNLLMNQVASAAFAQQVNRDITVSDEEVTEGYEVFVKSTDWRNGTILIAKSQDKKDMVDFYDRLSVASVDEKSKLKGLVSKMTEVIKDGNFYEASPNLSQLLLSLTEGGSFTQPVLIGQEWVVFYLKEVKEVSPIPFEEVKEGISENKKKQKLSIALQDYLKPVDINLKIN